MSVQVEGYRGENFEVLEAAVMETSRGRWFLEEFARRQRAKETLAILASLHKLEKALLAAPPNPSLLQRSNAQTQESLKFFQDDEDLFEPAPITPIPPLASAPPPKPIPENKGAKLHIHHAPIDSEKVMSNTLPRKDTPNPQKLDFEPTPVNDFCSEAPAVEIEEKPKQRVVIIRKQMDDDVSIPLLDDKTVPQASFPPIG